MALFGKKKKKKKGEEGETPEDEVNVEEGSEEEAAPDKDRDAETGEDGDGEGDELDLDGGKKGLKPIFIIGGAVLLLVLAGAGAYFSGLLDPLLGGGSDETAEVVKEEKEVKPSVFMEIPDLVVNLSTTQGPPRYLKLKVQLELAGSEDQAAVEAIAPRVIDHFQTYLRELRVSDLRGSAGIYRLRQELLARVNAAASPVEVKDVLFQEILIQ